MHFFSSILFKSRSPPSFSSSTTMETATNSQEEETGLKSLTSPSNHNHSSMINRFNISPQSSSASSSCTSPSSPVSISPFCSSSSSSSSFHSVDDDVTVSTDETPVTNHHHKQEEEEITEKPFYDHRKNVIIVRNQRSGIRREFPPPIPLLARTENLPCHMPWVLKRSYKDGRLVIKEVNVKHHEYFRAHRSNGRLTLQLMHMNHLTIHPPPNDTSSTTTTDDIEGEEEEEEEEQEEEDNVDVNDLVDFDNDDRDEKKNEDNKKDDDENDGISSEQEQGSDEEEEAEKVERPSADPLHHIRLRFRPVLSSEQPSSSLPQCQIHETREGKQDFDGEILRNCSQPLILASSLPEGRVRGMCQPNDYRKSNLFRLPIVSVRPVHS
ncbi:protein FAF-like, chloroplastic [Papaver somniferum]|uniref:protein FAF-like, chloroplastic n=1 Tax=Papaver somniferum TaxID=3469 RepID=UPI000E6FF4A7|nr:protein FAF-like, chloroplastic [Papaver somniferum]XP_026446924.1 protein FAF-like, chloroplastic [Papaver somniferum]